MTADSTGLDGVAAPPRANGELIFTAHWQSRLFATTMALREREVIDWERFRQGLISAIADHEQTLTNNDDFDYWGCWQEALEQLLATDRIVSSAALSAKADEYATRPPGHAH